MTPSRELDFDIARSLGWHIVHRQSPKGNEGKLFLADNVGEVQQNGDEEEYVWEWGCPSFSRSSKHELMQELTSANLPKEVLVDAILYIGKRLGRIPND